MKKIILCLFFSFILIILSQYAFTQNTISAKVSSSNTGLKDSIEVCSGSIIYLTSNISSSNWEDDFNSGILDFTKWESNTSVIFNNPCPPTNLPASGLSCWMGSSTTIPRILTSKVIDATNGLNTKVKWDMKYGANQNITNCESPDESTEGVHLQWSVDNGSSWNNFQGVDMAPSGTYGTPAYVCGSGGYWTPVSGNAATGPYYKWNHYETELPAAALSPFLRIRFFQDIASGIGFDNWGIDNVSLNIINNTFYTVFWSNGSNQLNPSPFIATTTQWYKVTLVDSTTNPPSFSYDSVFVKVNPFNNPVADFTTNSSFNCKNTTSFLHFTGNNTSISSYLWSYPYQVDSITNDNNGNLTIYWNQIGIDSTSVSVCLIVTDSNQCVSDTITKLVDVYSPANLLFTVDPNMPSGCAPLNVLFKIDSGQNVRSSIHYSWKLSNEISHQGNIFNYIFEEQGQYGITLYATDNVLGCKDTVNIFHIVDVFEKPLCDIFMRNDTLFTNYNEYYWYEWFLNDISVQSGYNTYYIPFEMGYYHVVITSINGCVSDPSDKFLIIDKSISESKDIIINNPTSDYFSLRYNNVVKKIEILNINGSIVKTFPNRVPYNTYDVNELSNALYFVRIYADDMVIINKLIKY